MVRRNGYILRRLGNPFIRLVSEFDAPEKRPRRGPRKRWKDVIKRVLEEVSTTVEYTQIGWDGDTSHEQQTVRLRGSMRLGGEKEEEKHEEEDEIFLSVLCT